MKKGSYHSEETKEKISQSMMKDFEWYHKDCGEYVLVLKIMKGSLIPKGFRPHKYYGKKEVRY